MNRKQILWLAVTTASIYLLATLMLVTMPIWFIVLMVRPSLVTPLSDKIMTEMTRRTMRVMFARPPTKASKVMP